MTRASDPIPPDDRDDDAVERDEPRREASMRLQIAGGAGGEAALREAMDPANQSLADALKLSYRVLQIAILGLLVTFLFSGFQTVQEGYTGVRTIFGRIVGEGADAQLAPGLEPFWPYPVGEIVVVRQTQSLALSNQFWPKLAGTLQRAIENADISNPIRPGIDGSVVTGDGDLAHLQVTAEYTIDDVSEFVRTVDRAASDALVRKALARGVVLAAAVTPLNDLLADREEPLRSRAGTPAGSGAAGAGTAPSAPANAPNAPTNAPTNAPASTPADGGADASGADSAAGTASNGTSGGTATSGADANGAAAGTGADGESGSRWSARRGELEQLIRQRAQEVLDRLDCGIRIVSVSVPESVAPLPVENKFAQVQVVREQAKEVVDRARQAARRTLVDVAGPSYPELLDGIRRYDAALVAGNQEDAEKLLAGLGERLNQPDIGGEVAIMLNQARAYQGAVESTLGAEARRIEGYASSFHENPRQLVRQLWLDSIRRVFHDGKNEVEVFSVPPGVEQIQLTATSSPDVMQARREAELARKKAAADAAGAMMRPFNLGVRGMGNQEGPGRLLNPEATKGANR